MKQDQGFERSKTQSAKNESKKQRKHAVALKNRKWRKWMDAIKLGE